MRSFVFLLAVAAILCSAVTAPAATTAPTPTPTPGAIGTPSPTPTPNPTPTPISSPGYQCWKRKLKAQGQHAVCRTQARHAYLGNRDLVLYEAAVAACEQRLTTVYGTADANNGSSCPETGDAALAIELGESFVALAEQVAGGGWLERVYVVGGSIVYDHRTGLVWEVKTTDVGSGTSASDPHDVDNVYTWSTGGPPYLPDGTVFLDFLARLNGATDGVCFAGYCDWRLPTKEDMETIVAPAGTCGGIVSCIDPLFGPTRAFGYWTTTTDAVDPQIVWIGNFGSGGVVSQFSKTNDFSARAVRGGTRF